MNGVANGSTMNNTFSNSSFNSMNNNTNQRPSSLCSSEPEIRWVDIISVPLMMAYVTRYIYGTDKLRTNAFEVRGINATSTGIIHLDDLAILSSWLKYINDNIVGLTNLQVCIVFYAHFIFSFSLLYECENCVFNMHNVCTLPISPSHRQTTDEALQSQLSGRRAHRVYGLGE